MSVCATLLCKDEADIVGSVVSHLLTQVDEVVVQDNGSTDGTIEILEGIGVEIIHDAEVGYFQDRKMSALAALALKRGHGWVIPCDADEVLYAPDGRTLSAYLAGVPPDVQVVSAELFNHIPSARDVKSEPDPLVRIGWRQRERAPLPKVVARCRPDLRINMGNHSVKTSGTALVAGGLVIRHFSWRSADQYLRKVRNGERAYAATDMPETTGAHWRMFAEHDDRTVRDHFYQWFWSRTPERDATLIYDPAPVGRAPSDVPVVRSRSPRTATAAVDTPIESA